MMKMKIEFTLNLFEVSLLANTQLYLSNIIKAMVIDNVVFTADD